MPLELCSLEDVKTFLLVRPGNTDLDERLLRLIRVASSQIEDATQMKLAGGVYTDLFDTRDARDYAYDFSGVSNDEGVIQKAVRQRILLKAAPVLSSANFSVHYDPIRGFGPETLVAPEYYVLHADRGELWLQYPTINWLQSLKVIYTAGYKGVGGADTAALPELPEDIRMACALQAVFLFRKTSPDNVGTDQDQGKGRGGAPSRFVSLGALTPEATELVLPYKRLLTGRG
jgi:hypothetical protein